MGNKWKVALVIVAGILVVLGILNLQSFLTLWEKVFVETVRGYAISAIVGAIVASVAALVIAIYNLISGR